MRRPNISDTRRAAWLLLGALAMAGCGEGMATMRTVHPPLGHRKVETSQTAYQFSRGRVIEIVLSREFALPGGEAVPDYEYVHITVPDTPGEYEAGPTGARVLRLVRIDREEFLYEGVSGTVDYRFAWLTKDHVHAEFSVETELVAPADASARRWHLEGEVQANESISVAQGLVNKYHPVIERLRREQAAEPAESAEQK